MTELVADRRPGGRNPEIADVMRHEAGAWTEDGEIDAALLHLLELVLLDRLAQFIVADSQLGDFGHGRGIVDCGNLPVAPVLERFRRGGVMPVAVDNHRKVSQSDSSCRGLTSQSKR